jgi:hypothetical protein
MNKRLKKLMARKETYILEHPDGNEELVLRGLTVKELSKFAEFAEAKDYTGALNYLLFITFRENTPTPENDPQEGMTDDDLNTFIKSVDGKISLELIKKIQELSGLVVPDEVKSVGNLDALKRKEQ